MVAGHDINYLASSGVLDIVADSEGRPVIPLNLLADFGGGGLMAAFAIMVALYERESSGRGQSIDLSMLDGTFSLLTHAASLHLARGADLSSGQFFLNGAVPQYGTYRSSDRRWYAVGALEPWFYENLMTASGRPDLADAHDDPGRYDEVRAHLVSWFGARSSEEVESALDGSEVCVNRVRTFPEALELAAERGMMVSVDGIPQMGVAARLSRTPARVRGGAPEPGRDTHAVRNGSGSALQEGAVHEPQ
jgi:alpha-methylacyl-CoA racemase